MKKVLISLFVIFSNMNCYAINSDTKIILQQIDKRFNQIDKRFEQANKQFDITLKILYILMGLVFASPFIAIYLKNKQDAEYRQNIETIKGILFALRELAQDNDKIARSLKAAGLM